MLHFRLTRPHDFHENHLPPINLFQNTNTEHSHPNTSVLTWNSFSCWCVCDTIFLNESFSWPADVIMSRTYVITTMQHSTIKNVRIRISSAVTHLLAVLLSNWTLVRSRNPHSPPDRTKHTVCNATEGDIIYNRNVDRLQLEHDWLLHVGRIHKHTRIHTNFIHKHRALARTHSQPLYTFTVERFRECEREYRKLYC